MCGGADPVERLSIWRLGEPVNSGLKGTKAGICRILKKGKEQTKSEISEKAGSTIISVKAFQAQAYDTVEGADPATHVYFRIRSSEDRMTVKGGTAGVAGEGWKNLERLLPPFYLGFRA